MKTKGLGIIVFLLAVVLALWAGGGPGHFIHFPSLMYFVFATAGLTLMKYRRGDERTSVLGSVKRYAVLSGLIGSFLALVQFAYNLSSPQQYIAGVCVALMPTFYGLVVFCVADALSRGD